MKLTETTAWIAGLVDPDGGWHPLLFEEFENKTTAVEAAQEYFSTGVEATQGAIVDHRPAVRRRVVVDSEPEIVEVVWGVYSNAS